MTRTEQTLICMLGILALNTSAKAITPIASGPPYQGIVERNIFGLQPASAQPAVIVPKPPLPKLILTGIAGGFISDRAVVKMIFPPKSGEPGRERCCVLSIGEREADLEMLEIRRESRMVRVRYASEEMTLSFEPSAASTKPVAAQPNSPPPGPSVMTAPESQFTAEQQVILMEIERQRNKGNPNAAPLPPTELTSPEDAAALMAPGSAVPEARPTGGRPQRAPR